METVNARITGTSLEICDHGVLTFWVFLEWHGGGQGLGGYALDQNGGRVGWGGGLIAIRSILETVGVNSWEKLKGQLVRAKVGGLGDDRPPIIGHIIEDRWFDLKEFVEAHKCCRR